MLALTVIAIVYYFTYSVYIKPLIQVAKRERHLDWNASEFERGIISELRRNWY